MMKYYLSLFELFSCFLAKMKSMDLKTGSTTIIIAIVIFAAEDGKSSAVNSNVNAISTTNTKIKSSYPDTIKPILRLPNLQNELAKHLSFILI